MEESVIELARREDGEIDEVYDLALFIKVSFCTTIWFSKFFNTLKNIFSKDNKNSYYD